MEDEVHEVVTLLLARMESHPEEFKSHADRWDRVLLEILEHGSEAEIAAIHASVRNIRLGEAHEDMMDELLNGEDRRRKEAEENDYERNLSKALQQSQYGQANQLLNQAYNQLGGLVGVGTQSPTTKLDVAPGILNSIRKGFGV